MHSRILSLLIMGILCANLANAELWVVKVSNFQFDPANVNVKVGDTIQWQYVNGFHTTTSTDVPLGATTWDADMKTAGQIFNYKITVAGNYKYFCSIHPTSMKGTINATDALPLVFGSFAIQPGKTASSAKLTWSTLSESNTSYFSIRRSFDAASFTEIGRVNAAGNSDEKRTYSYTDNAVNNNYRYVYYTIKVVDKDGRETFTEIKSFTNTVAVKKIITELTPNPVNNGGHLMFRFNADRESEMLVRLYNSAGKLVKEANMYATEGLNNGHFHMGGLPLGTYRVVFLLDGKKESYQVVLQ